MRLRARLSGWCPWAWTLLTSAPERRPRPTDADPGASTEAGNQGRASLDLEAEVRELVCMGPFSRTEWKARCRGHAGCDVLACGLSPGALVRSSSGDADLHLAAQARKDSLGRFTREGML